MYMHVNNLGNSLPWALDWHLNLDARVHWLLESPL